MCIAERAMYLRVQSKWWPCGEWVSVRWLAYGRRLQAMWAA